MRARASLTGVRVSGVRVYTGAVPRLERRAPSHGEIPCNTFSEYEERERSGVAKLTFKRARSPSMLCACRRARSRSSAVVRGLCALEQVTTRANAPPLKSCATFSICPVRSTTVPGSPRRGAPVTWTRSNGGVFASVSGARACRLTFFHTAASAERSGASLQSFGGRPASVQRQ